MHTVKTLLVLVVFGFGTTVFAQQTSPATPSPETKEKIKEKINAMTSEEKAAAKDKMKAKWDAMTPEEKAAAKDKVKEKYNAMTSEEKAAAKDKIKARRNGK